MASRPTTDEARLLAGETIYVVALQLIKADGPVTTFSMSQSWRRGGTRESALSAAMDFARDEKPGFAVQEWLICEIPGLDGRALAQSQSKEDVK